MTLAPTYQDLAGLYDRLAPDYDKLHHRWLRYAGGEAQSALEAAVRVLASPTTHILDAGCGTGAFARRLFREKVIAPHQVSLMDPSDAMLLRCADLPCLKARGRLEAMPFEDARFDLVTCAWALETATHPAAAIEEMYRVLRPGGTLCLAFCADQPARGVVQKAIRQTLSLRGTGRFLSLKAVRAAIMATGAGHVVSVPVTGPVAMLVAKREG
ncbi:class I SAM-dependent methyltransferase [Cognatiyoonia sp. IB215182]|uniref:class I SAM-dependent methyltransferase n=1 Tax=Cognatiyoonia sp. IB215182 TaxID=3097353 RepID=UPI002A14FDA7|nr:methyltransferase domain-containing protein [Cognatiyoonia sp. IB215182]MDX8352950.1 methyltransferase domain-containing protein [Cognatiyoonia sp. IB215182]